MKILAAILVLLVAVISPVSAAEFTSPLSPQLPVGGGQRAFPTAQGYGAIASGGRGGVVIHVTNRNDAGAGSLREAVENGGGVARTIVFDIGGIIDVVGNLRLDPSGDNNVTIAGQTAPGDGVCLRGGTINVRSTNVIIRHMCFRRGDFRQGANRNVGDGFMVTRGIDVIADHLSVSWSIDEAFQAFDDETSNTTIQYSIFAEPINGLICCFEPQHGYGPLFAGDGDSMSFHHNLITHIKLRGPRLDNYTDADIVNNIIYNWSVGATHFKPGAGSDPIQRINVINNVYRRGGDDIGFEPMIIHTGVTHAANIYFGNGNEFHDGGDITEPTGTPVRGTKNARDADVDIITFTAAETWDTLLDNVGAIVPVLDPIDAAVIADVRNGTGGIIICVDSSNRDDPPLLDDTDPDGEAACNSGTQSSFGSFYAYPNVSRLCGAVLAYDTDCDGMPDQWESDHGLNPNLASDGNDDMVGDGWTNLEYYLNQKAGDYPPGLPLLPVGGLQTIGAGR